MEKPPEAIQTQLFSILRKFLVELESTRNIRTLDLNLYLDRDLGIDSLSKAELFHRIEKEFHIQISDRVIAEAETINDIVSAIHNALPQKSNKRFAIVTPATSLTSTDPSSKSTLTEILLLYAENEPDKPHIYLQDENGNEQIITYGKLHDQARKVASGLKAYGLKEKETVALMLPTSEAFFYSFFGILLAGAIPVPIYPPLRPDRIAEYAMREASILRNAEIRIMITFHRAEAIGRLLHTQINSLKYVVTLDELIANANLPVKIKNKKSDAALIQYTSGSTSNPKGVLLTHDNLLANIRAIGKAIKIIPTDKSVSWLPLYHDMGLIGAWLGSFYHGIPVIIMSPLSFLIRPERWLWTMHYHRATLSASPNFGYELCIRKIPQQELKGLDLSSWRIAFNGAEGVSPNTVRHFVEKFKPYGFKEETLYPVYGLAENAVALTFPNLAAKPRIDRINRAAFENELTAIPVAQSEKKYLEFISCGKPLEQHEIRIVDENDQNLPERHVGRLYFRGPSAMQGYYRNSEITHAMNHEGWWDSGDIAYLAEGELFIAGRRKDLIIKAGRNIYPDEIEETAAEVTGVRKGCVAAFGFYDAQTGTEKIIVVAESAETNKEKKKEIAHNVTDKITILLGIPPDRVLIVKPHTIPKTSSGKLRRSTCKEKYLEGKLGQRRLPVWLQVLGLTLSGISKKIWRWICLSGRILYTSYVVSLVLILFVPLWLSIVAPPRSIAQKLTKFWMKTIFLLSGCPIIVQGKQNLQKGKSVLYVVNHASYIDAGVLTAVLPTPLSIVSKREFEKTPILKTFITKLGHLFVERFDFAKSMEDTLSIQKNLQEGASIAIFAEGTFSYTSGLRPFRMGAFKTAAETNIPICPVALNGTRKILRGNYFLLRPGIIRVHIDEYVYPPQEVSWDHLVQFRAQVRNKIAKCCGEDMINA